MLIALICDERPLGYMVGGLFAFMMIPNSSRQPLLAWARLVED